MGKIKMLLVIITLVGTILAGRVLGEGPALFGQPFEDQGAYITLSDISERGSLEPVVITGGKLNVSDESPIQKLLNLVGIQI